MSDSFINACLSGDAMLDDVDEWIDRWHEEEPAERIHAWLGMTPDEYATWVEQPSALRFIVAAHRAGVALRTILEEQQKPQLVAARSDDPSAAKKVLEWLQRTGRM